MKKAMSLIELVIVIVLIGILSAVLAPSFKRNNLQQATNQIISHIRYTQHLAMMDNKFSNTDTTWYRKRWQISFSKNATGGTSQEWKYVIYSDISKSGNPNSKKEVARNPGNINQYLIGWKTSGIEPTNKLNIGKTFGIKTVNFLGGCSSAKRLSFDHLGRPFQGNTNTQNSPYQSGRYITNQCIIKLTDNENKSISIAIEPETGYVHQL